MTAGYRNDAMRIDAGGVFNLRGPIHLPDETVLTLLEQDFESALAAIPSGYGEGVYEGLPVRRHRVQVLRRKADQPVRASARGAATSSASTLTD
jgi:hypothetical protein